MFEYMSDDTKSLLTFITGIVLLICLLGTCVTYWNKSTTKTPLFEQCMGKVLQSNLHVCLPALEADKVALEHQKSN